MDIVETATMKKYGVIDISIQNLAALASAAAAMLHHLALIKDIVETAKRKNPASTDNATHVAIPPVPNCLWSNEIG